MGTNIVREANMEKLLLWDLKFLLVQEAYGKEKHNQSLDDLRMEDQDVQSCQPLLEFFVVFFPSFNRCKN